MERQPLFPRLPAMDIASILVVIVVLGLIYWLVTNYLPLPPGVKQVITVIAVLILCLWLLNMAGLTHVSFPHR